MNTPLTRKILAAITESSQTTSTVTLQLSRLTKTELDDLIACADGSAPEPDGSERYWGADWTVEVQP